MLWHFNQSSYPCRCLYLPYNWLQRIEHGISSVMSRIGRSIACRVRLCVEYSRICRSPPFGILLQCSSAFSAVFSSVVSLDLAAINSNTPIAIGWWNLKNCERYHQRHQQPLPWRDCWSAAKSSSFFWFQQNLHQIPGFTEEHPLGTVPGATWYYGWSSLVPCGKWYHGATGNRKIHQEYIPILDFLWNIRKAGELNHPFSGKFGCIQPIILDTLDIISHVPIHIESRGSRKPYDFSRCSTYTGFSRSKPNWRWLLPGW